MSQLHPIGKNILVEPVADEEKTASGIVLPDIVNKEVPQMGKIIEVGDAIETNVKAGDTIFFKKYQPDEIEVDGKKFLVMEEDAILVTVTD